MGQHMLNVLLNLLSTGIGFLIGWLAQKIIRKRLRHRRLRQLQAATTKGEVAICLRVGGLGDPVPDVLEYLQEHHASIRNLLVYRVSAEEAKSKGGELDDPQTAYRIIEDICDGIKAYGKERATRIHFFPAGMIAYPLVLGAMLGNWGPAVVVYHKSKDYVPLYELDKDWLQKGKNDFASLTAWEVIQLNPQT